MGRRSAWVGAIAVVTLVGAGACREEPKGWTPVLEQTSTTFLQTLTERAMEKVRAARQAVSDEPRQAIATLDEADAVLQELLEFYLPIFEARELTYNAYRELYLGRADDSARIIGEVESHLHSVAKRDPRFHRAVLKPLEHAEAARLALESGVSEEGQQALDVLANELNFLILKGDLVLAEG